MATRAKTPLGELYQRPGFMIRRVHQIAVSLFMEETGKLGVTNRQYGILFVLRHQPGIDQISVANLLGLDRSTTGMVLKKLEADGLVAAQLTTDAIRRGIAPTAHRTGKASASACAVSLYATRAEAFSSATRQIYSCVQRIHARSF